MFDICAPVKNKVKIPVEKKISEIELMIEYENKSSENFRIDVNPYISIHLSYEKPEKFHIISKDYGMTCKLYKKAQKYDNIIVEYCAEENKLNLIILPLIKCL